MEVLDETNGERGVVDEGGDKQDRCRFVGGVYSEEVEDESVECYSSIMM